jgi:2-dehydro-3-deoxyphosphooctonate aldolase (KDO 8-P synthase)
MLGLSVMKKFSYPVLLDATHALQLPGGLAEVADGRRENVTELSLAGLSQGLAGLFIEAHPDPESALCDGPCALRLDKLAPFLDRMVAIDALIKQFEPLDTR